MPAGRPTRTTLTQLQVQAIALMARQGCSASSVQRQLNLSASTWQAWRRGELFVPALNAAKAEYEEEVWSGLRAAAGSAAQTLVDLHADPAEKGSVRMMAANSILDRSGYRAREKVEVAVVQPYQTREELVQALSALPVDLLHAALASRGSA